MVRLLPRCALCKATGYALLLGAAMVFHPEAIPGYALVLLAELVEVKHLWRGGR